MLSEMEEQAALKHARTEGLEEGKSLGIKEEKISTAKKMLKLGIEIELIEQATGLTKEEILELKNK